LHSETLTQLTPVEKLVLGTKSGRAKHVRIMPGGALEADQDVSSIFVGSKLDEHRGAFILDHPMDKGEVTESGWNAMEKLWEVSVQCRCFQSG